MSGEERKRRLEQPFNPADWAIHMRHEVLQQLQSRVESQAGDYPLSPRDLNLTKYSSLEETLEHKAVQGFTFYVDQVGLIREMRQNVFREGFDHGLSVQPKRVTFTSSFMYFPETVQFTHSEGPTVAVSSQAEFSPLSLSFTGLDAHSVTIGSGLLYQPLRNYPDLGLKPAHGELVTSVGIIGDSEQRFKFLNDKETDRGNVQGIDIWFEDGEGGRRRVILEHPSSNARVIFEMNVAPHALRPEALLSGQPIFPVKVSFENK